jgi:uncharacterized protein YjiS (DUF1127 family)
VIERERSHCESFEFVQKNQANSNIYRKTTNCAGDHISHRVSGLLLHHHLSLELERTMNTNPKTTTSTWNQFKTGIVEWRRRARSREELMGLSDRCLRDIGLTRADAKFEATKPFWMA